MSFILDALRKSDTEHQQQSRQGLTTPQQPAPQARKSIWIPVLVVVLVLNAAALAWVLATRPAEDPATDTAGITTGPATLTETRSLRREAENEPTESAAEPVDDAPKRGDTKPTPEPAPMQAAVAPVRPRGAAAIEAREPVSDSIRPSLPTFEQLALGGIISTSPLHLDMHVFAGERDKRFVFINMSKYREGEALKEGPVVEEITSTGVVLSHQGSRFTLDRN